MSDNGEEVRIVVVLDNSDVDSGVDRVRNATRRMKQVVEEETAKVGGDAGAKSGDAFIKSFAGRILASMLLRDAIRESLAVVQQAIQDFQNSINFATGSPQSKSRSFTQWIADVMFVDPARRAVLIQGGLPAATAAGGAAGLSAANADAQRAAFLQAAKDNPSILAPTSVLEGQLNAVISQRGEAAHRNAEEQASARTGGDFQRGEQAEKLFKTIDEGLAKSEAQARELLSLGKERDKQVAEGDKKSATAAREVGNAKVKAVNEAMGLEVEKQEAIDAIAKRKQAADAKEAREKEEADKKAAAHAKEVKEHALSAQEELLETSRHSAEAGLRFDEKSLGQTKATSAVMINGGLFGRNDSAILGVQYAAQQVSLLRSIDAEIKQLRQEKADLTLQ